MAEQPQDIVLVTRGGRLIGVSIDGTGEGADLARSVVRSLASLCDSADEMAKREARGCAVSSSDSAFRGALTTWDMRWHRMAIPFGERKD